MCCALYIETPLPQGNKKRRSKAVEEDRLIRSTRKVIATRPGSDHDQS